MTPVPTLNRASRLATTLLALGLGAAAHAQFPQTPQFGGQGQTRSRSTAAGSTRQYYNNSTIGDAMISVDPESRRIIVITDDETSEYVGQVITNLDRPKPQVLIKVVFLEVTYNKSSDVGLEGGFRKKIDSSTTGTGANAFGLSGLNAVGGTNALANVFGQPVTSFAPTPPGAGLYQVLGQDYQVTLRAIAQAGNAEVLSRPSVLARNNQPATITVGQSVPLISNVRYDNFGNALYSPTYTDVGIILRVTPFITTDGMVEMIVAPELSSISATDKVPIGAGVEVPVIDKRSADTVVVTPDGQPVIIGGLMGRQKSVRDSKIPLLGDIPLLGNAFKRKARAEAKTELLIFLTPHIVQAPSQLAALSDSERSKSTLVPKAFTEQELDEFLDKLPSRPDEQSSPPPPPSSTPQPQPRNSSSDSNLIRQRY
ncbi:MAG: hypothetical protein FJ387_21735 [Verrucomicrobia bacterium]|nr:hypothetical protein [Verrucomicrobiota bacterium]